MFRRTAVAIVTGLLAAGCVRAPLVIEAERGDARGLVTATTRPGYSGEAYLSGFDGEQDRVLFDVHTPGGFYDLRVVYAAAEDKGFVLDVNGVRRQAFFPASGDAFALADAGLVDLPRGRSAVAIEKGWGWYDVDRIELRPAARPARPPRPPAEPVNPRASPQARRLLALLVEGYGRRTLSGVYSHEDFEHVRRVTGRAPAVLGGDLMDYSPSRLEHGADPGDTTERLIQAARDGAIITLSWHWNAPSGLLNAEITDARGRQINALWYKGFNSNATTFDLAAALADPRSNDYRLLLRDIDAIAVELRKFADAGVPVLWRPLHEADGRWFWWGASGPAPFRALWRLMHDRLTGRHGLNNLLWVYTGTQRMEWYPDDATFDIIGVDAYPPGDADPLSATWRAIQKRYAGRKLIALSEIGGVPDVAAMHRHGVWFAWFASWTGDLGPRRHDDADLVRRYGARGARHADAATAAVAAPPAAR